MRKIRVEKGSINLDGPLWQLEILGKWKWLVFVYLVFWTLDVVSVVTEFFVWPAGGMRRSARLGRLAAFNRRPLVTSLSSPLFSQLFSFAFFLIIVVDVIFSSSSSSSSSSSFCCARSLGFFCSSSLAVAVVGTLDSRRIFVAFLVFLFGICVFFFSSCVPKVGWGDEERQPMREWERWWPRNEWMVDGLLLLCCCCCCFLKIFWPGGRERATRGRDRPPGRWRERKKERKIERRNVKRSNEPVPRR